jgi:hypothetical protein
MNHPRHPDFPNDDHDDEWGSALTRPGDLNDLEQTYSERPKFLPEPQGPSLLFRVIEALFALILLGLGGFILFRLWAWALLPFGA